MEVENENELTEEVRRRFFAENGEKPQEFHDDDVSRLKSDNLWISSFLKSRDYEVDKALAALVECLKWRNTFGVNDLTERLIDRRLFEAGFLYPHNQDKQGNTIFNFVARLYKKNPDEYPEVKKMLVFLLEKHARCYPGRKILFIFDMQETGLANMDMDFVKFIISCFTTYFPCTLALLIVLEMPWILSAAWKLVKTWLSPKAVKKIKFINKTELLDYVNEENLLVSMGGTDSFEYSYPPKDTSMGYISDRGSPQKEPLSMATVDKNGEETVELMESFETDGEPAQASPRKETCSQNLSCPVDLLMLLLPLLFWPYPSLLKRVKFQDESGQDINASTPRVRQRNSSSLKSRPKQQLSSNPESKLSTESSVSSSSVSSSTSSGLIISPSDEFVFSGTTASGGEILQALNLTNSSTDALAFKIKTTSPESYRVRPSSGIVPSNSSVEISVYLQPGHAASVMRDKFLIMSAKVEEEKSATDLAALWKALPKSVIEEHRLRCRFVAVSNQQFTNADSPSGLHGNEYVRDADTAKDLKQKLCEIDKKVEVINKKLSYLEEGLQVFIKIQLVILSAMIVLFGVVLYYVTLR